MVIHRFEVPRDDQIHEVAFWGSVFAINGVSLDLVEFWALDTPDPGWRLAPRRMQLVGTGQPLPTGFSYWGTVILPIDDRRRAVWHLIELLGE